MLNTFDDHAVYREFKHLTLHTPVALVFPAGASGQFLAGLISGAWQRSDTAMNDYNAADVLWFHMDDNSWLLRNGVMLPNVDPDVLRSLAADLSSNLHDHQHRLGIGHELPYHTSKIYDLKIHELIVLTVHPDDHWIAGALRWFKNNLSCDHRGKPYMIAGILNHNRFTGTVNYAEFQNMLRHLKERNPLIEWPSTACAWNYYLDRKADLRDPIDLSAFSDHIQQGISPHNTMQLYAAACSNDRRTWFRERVPVYTEIDYRDLFFGLNAPASSRLSSLDFTAIAAYSARNLDVLNLVADLVGPEQCIAMRAKIKALRQLLASAMATCRG